MEEKTKEKGRIEEALGKYNLNLSDDEVKAAVKKIIAERVHENDTPEVKKFLMGSVELTTLKTTDSDESVMAFTERVNAFDEQYPALPHVATICVYPRFARIVSETLEVDGVEIACVISLRLVWVVVRHEELPAAEGTYALGVCADLQCGCTCRAVDADERIVRRSPLALESC